MANSMRSGLDQCRATRHVGMETAYIPRVRVYYSLAASPSPPDRPGGEGLVARLSVLLREYAPPQMVSRIPLNATRLM